MNYVDRFQRLSDAYKNLMLVAFRNLKVIKDYETIGVVKKLVAKRPLGRMARFNFDAARNELTSTEDGIPTALILGEFNERMAFYPSITEKILKIHGVANVINAALDTKTISSERALIQPLQDTLLDFYFLGKTFLFYSHKAKIIDGNVQNMIERKVDLEHLLASYQHWISSEMDIVSQACLDVDHLNRKLKQYVIKSWSWIGQQVGDEGKVVNDYLLPKEYWEPFLKHAAKAQAGAMAH